MIEDVPKILIDVLEGLTVKTCCEDELVACMREQGLEIMDTSQDRGIVMTTISIRR